MTALFLIITALIPFKLRFLKPLAAEDLAIALFAAATFFCGVKWKEFFWGRQTRYITLFALALILFAPFSAKEIDFLLTIFLFPLLLTTNLKENVITRCCFVIVLVSLFQAAVAIGQYFLQHPLGLKMLGEVKFTSRHLQPATYQFDKTVIRAYGTMIHPNVLGGFLAFSIFCSYLLFLESSKKKLLVLIIFFQLFALLLTFSRSALFGWILGTVFWFYAVRERRRLGIILAFFSFLCLLLLYPQLVARGGIVSYNLIAAGSDATRWKLQKEALSLILDHPFFGVGFQNYLHYFPHYVHNIYLLIGAEMGMVGLFLFLALIASVVKKSWPERKSPTIATLLSILIAFLFIGMCDFYLWVHIPGRVMFFLVLGLLGIKVRIPAITSLHVNLCSRGARRLS